MSQNSFDNTSAAKAVDTKGPQGSDYLQYLQNRQAGVSDIEGLLCADDKMIRIKEIIKQIKNTDVSVLISGESGTGKEVIARAIHSNSDRNDKPFVAINCAALPSNLLESELFGYEKGAFTGAHQQHRGKFEQADGGTLLLDEVTEMEPALQAKLLRALQEREIERVGGSGPVPVNCRIIATTNRDIVKYVAQGNFRQDLYYRLYVIHMEVPALRDRPKDIELLSNHFLRRYEREFGKEGMQFSVKAKEKLEAHAWNGNVRELQNVVQRSVLLANGPIIGSEDIPITIEKAVVSDDWVDTLPIGRPLKDLETRFILETLRYHKGNRTHAAKTLGISLRTLRNKINEFTAGGYEVMSPQNGRHS
jgi:two-component system response regulator FlrC